MAFISGTGNGDTITPTLVSSGVTGGLPSDAADTINAGAGNDLIDGGSGDDILNGEDGDDTIVGGLGSDTVSGGAGSNFLSYQSFPGPISVSFSGPVTLAGTVAEPGGTIDTFSNIRGIFGTSAADTLIGLSDTAVSLPYALILRGRGGDDLIDGRNSQLNQASYADATTSVVIALQESIDGAGNIIGYATGAGVGTDILVNVRRATGGSGNDSLSGSDRDDRFDASAGSDTIMGGLGFNFVDYATVTGPITVTTSGPGEGLFGLGAATVAKPGAVTDITIDVNEWRGTNGADSFVGLASGIYTWLSYSFRGGAGNDTINGQGSAANRADYLTSTTAITVDLTAGTATDGLGGTDTLIDVRRVRGTSNADTLNGSAFDDQFELPALAGQIVDGRGGNNRITIFGSTDVTIDLGSAGVAAPGGFGGFQGLVTTAGGGSATLYNISQAVSGSGDDTLRGGALNDLLSGGSGDNLLDGGSGTNNTVSYRSWAGPTPTPTKGAVIDLRDGVNGTATNPWDGTDTLINIHSAIGTQFADTITGAARADGLRSYIRGDGGHDLLLGSSGAVSADYSGALSAVSVDLNLGTASDDGWFGGQDTLVGITGVRGSGFADVLVGSYADDYVEGGEANDTLLGLGGHDTLLGGGGDDVIYAYAGDSISGGAGRDVLYMVDDTPASLSIDVAGIEYVAAGFGNDTIIGAGQTRAIEVYASGGDDSVVGGSGHDWLWGSVGNDTLIGNAGDDVIVGDLGADSLSGGDGNDRIYVDAQDTIDGGAGFDAAYISGGTGMAINLAATRFEWVTDFVNGNDTLDASGTTTGVELYAGGGNDLLTGGSGDDLVFAGEGADTLVGGAGDDGLIGEGGGDSISGGDGNDRIYADASDTVDGGAGYDIMYMVTDAAFTVDLGAIRVEWLFAGGGNDNVSSSTATPIQVYANGGNDTVSGGGGNDTLWGGDGDDSLAGNAGADILVGGAGSDTINGGAGDDGLYGGTGADLFVLGSSWEADTIFDWQDGVDHIDATALVALGLHGIGGFSVTTSGTNAVIAFAGNTLTVGGAAGLIDAADFLFA